MCEPVSPVLFAFATVELGLDLALKYCLLNRQAFCSSFPDLVRRCYFDFNNIYVFCVSCDIVCRTLSSEKQRRKNEFKIKIAPFHQFRIRRAFRWK